MKNASSILFHLGVIRSCTIEMCAADVQSWKLRVSVWDEIMHFMWGWVSLHSNEEQNTLSMAQAVLLQSIHVSSLLKLFCWHEVFAFHFEVSRKYLVCTYYK